MLKSILPIFFSRSFIVSTLTLKSLIHFEFIFVYGVKVKSLSRVQLFATPRAVAYQAPPSMGFSGKNTEVGCHFLLQEIFLKLTEICGTLHPKATEYAFFSSAQRAFSRIDKMKGHGRSISKFKRIKIIASVFSDHNAVSLEINCKGKNLQNSQTVGV